MVPHATVNHIPTLTGGVGAEALTHFYRSHFISKMPSDTKIEPIDRTVGTNSRGVETVVDEFVFSFTHDVAMDWMLPGVEPTGKQVRVPFVVVVQFQGDLLLSERIWWDQATVLLQLGLLPPATLPCVSGPEQATKAADVRALPSNQLIREPHGVGP